MMSLNNALSFGVGVIVGGVVGYGSMAIAVPPDIAEAVSHISAYSVSPDGVMFPLEIKPLLRYIHNTNVQSVMFALVSSGDLRGLGYEKDNPEAVMSVYFGAGVVFELGQQSGWDVIVFYDDIELFRLTKMSKGVRPPSLS